MGIAPTGVNASAALENRTEFVLVETNPPVDGMAGQRDALSAGFEYSRADGRLLRS
jgi:hypothetical protein